MLQEDYIIKNFDISESQSKLRASSFLQSEYPKEVLVPQPKVKRKVTQEKSNLNESHFLIKRMASHASKINASALDESILPKDNNISVFKKKYSLAHLISDESKGIASSKLKKAETLTSPNPLTSPQFNQEIVADLEEQQKKLMEDLMGNMRAQHDNDAINESINESPINKKNMFASYISDGGNQKESNQSKSIEQVDLDDLEAQQKKIMEEMFMDMGLQPKTPTNEQKKEDRLIVENSKEEETIQIDDLEEQQRKIMEELMAGFGPQKSEDKPLLPQKGDDLSEKRSESELDIDVLEQQQKKLMEELMMGLATPVVDIYENEQTVQPPVHDSNRFIEKSELTGDNAIGTNQPRGSILLVPKQPSKGEIILQSRRSSANFQKEVSIGQSSKKKEYPFKNHKADLHDECLSEDSSEIDMKPGALFYKPSGKGKDKNIVKSSQELPQLDVNPTKERSTYFQNHANVKPLMTNQKPYQESDEVYLVPSPDNSRHNIQVLSRAVSDDIDEEKIDELRKEEPKREPFLKGDFNFNSKIPYDLKISSVETSEVNKKKAPIIKKKLSTVLDAKQSNQPNLLPRLDSLAEVSPGVDFRTGLTPMNKGLIKVKKVKKEFDGELYSSKDSSISQEK